MKASLIVIVAVVLALLVVPPAFGLKTEEQTVAQIGPESMVVQELVFEDVLPDDVCFSSEGVPLKESVVLLSVAEDVAKLPMLFGGKPIANYVFEYVDINGNEVHQYYVLSNGELLLTQRVVFEGNLCKSSQN